jgi:carbon starvation protein
MLGESTLGLLATLACTAGLASKERWHSHYSSWDAVSALPKKIDAFIHGTTSFVTSLGVPTDLAAALIAMVVVSFALTTLDSATRLLRFNIEEIGARLGMPFLGNRYLASIGACAVIGLFAFFEIDGKPAGLALWALFGTTNQLLAALTLSVVTLYLKRLGKSVWYTGIPALFVMLTTLTAMARNLRDFCSIDGFEGTQPNGLLFAVGTVLFLLGVAVLVETGLAMGRKTT